ncbi:VQ motif-containing protein 19-like [Zingiber officinale]|nr:VQ motif-containing protein 19-like [Zingiber officinale]
MTRFLAQQWLETTEQIPGTMPHKLTNRSLRNCQPATSSVLLSLRFKLSRPSVVMETLPTSPSSATSGSCISISINGGGTPKSIDSSSSPTTFVQADCSSFKKVVQMLTGGTSFGAAPPTNAPLPPPRSKVPGTGPKRKSFKLYERRESLKNLKMKNLTMTLHKATVSRLPPRNQPSPSSLDFPDMYLSPITPLVADPFCPRWTSAEQDCDIAERGFYLRPSPREAEPPKLLPLFPLTSPKMSSA